jgi:uncharacterized protein
MIKMNFLMISVMVKKVVGLFLIVVFSLVGFAKEVPSKPDGHNRFVNDHANVLSPDQIRNLNLKLFNYWDSTSSEMIVVIDKSLEDDDLEDYSQKLAQAWGIGMKGKDNGLLLYISIDDRAIRIHIGYGLEGAIPDFLAGRVIDEIIKPNFKQELYGKGINEGLDALISLAEGEHVFDEKDRQKKSKGFPTLLIIVIIIIIIIFISNIGESGGQTYNGSRGPFMGGTGWGGFSGGGGYGGGSGGGFGGGFGGGSFGGGGASGSW